MNRNIECKTDLTDSLYRKCISDVSFVVCELNPEGTVLFVNDAIINAAGYYPEELLGKNWWDMFFPGELNEKVETFYQIFSTTIDVTNFEASIMTKEGVLKVFEWKSSNHYLSDGTLHSILLFGFDVIFIPKITNSGNNLLHLFPLLNYPAVNIFRNRIRSNTY